MAVLDRESPYMKKNVYEATFLAVDNGKLENLNEIKTECRCIKAAVYGGKNGFERLGRSAWREVG